jgi:hypothetical protein
MLRPRAVSCAELLSSEKARSLKNNRIRTKKERLCAPL